MIVPSAVSSLFCRMDKYIFSMVGGLGTAIFRVSRKIKIVPAGTFHDMR